MKVTYLGCVYLSLLQLAPEELICTHCLIFTCPTEWSLILQTFNEVQKLLSKTNGQVVGDLMTPAPLVVRETTNLEDAARFVVLFSLFCMTF